MRVNQALTHFTSTLQADGIATARLDCLVLLEDVLNTNRTQILSEPGRELTDEQYTILCIAMEKRARHIPLSYVRGKTEFYGREFTINRHVLEPRPESETMIDMLKKLAVDSPDSIENALLVDVGTGSGALAITARLELPAGRVVATDVDRNCLAIARKNAHAQHADIDFLLGDLLSPLYKLRIINYKLLLLCNLPYVPDDFQINRAAMHEPKRAIFGGPDGLNLYRHLLQQATALTPKPDYILTESLPPQHKTLQALALQSGYRQTLENDFIQLFSVAA